MARRRRPATDDTNWTARDEVDFYAEQVKAAPGAAKALVSIPFTVAREARAMLREMRSDEPPKPER